MEIVLSVDVVGSTNHKPFLHADSLKMHTQNWSCMQTAYKFNVEQTKPGGSDCSTILINVGKKLDRMQHCVR